MVKGRYTTYKQLRRRQHGTSMKVIIVCLLGVVVLTGITGHFFSRREVTTTSPPTLHNPHHEALVKLIRTSEDAIGWIGNKTIDSINNIKNLTASAVTPESALVIKKNKFMKWLRGVVHYNGSNSSSSSGAAVDSTEAPEDSGERLVIAHRTPDRGFSWGSPTKKKSDGDGNTNSTGLLSAAGRRVHSLLSYLYQTTRDFTEQGSHFLKSGIDKAKTTGESLRTKILKIREGHEDPPVEPTGILVPTPADVVNPCDDGEENVCAVDWGRNAFSFFQKECWVRVYNELHHTSFSVQDRDVCFNLFSQNPENYQKIENPYL